MKLNKNFCLLLLIAFIISCNSINNKNPSDVIDGDFFEIDEAKKLNSEGIKLSQQGKLELGLSKFFKSLKLEPNNPTVLSNIGLNEQLLYNFNEAEVYFNKALKSSDSTYLIAGVNLGVVYYELEKYEKGIEILNFVIKNQNDKSTLASAKINRALNLIEINKCKEAVKDLNYIKLNREKIFNSVYHIKDIEDKLKYCNQ